MHAKDRWESNLEMLDPDPERIFEVLRRDHIWDVGLVTTYLALCKRFGVRPVREAAERVLGQPVRKSPWRR